MWREWKTSIIIGGVEGMREGGGGETSIINFITIIPVWERYKHFHIICRAITLQRTISSLKFNLRFSLTNFKVSLENSKVKTIPCASEDN
jgi:hypothetical protein